MIKTEHIFRSTIVASTSRLLLLFLGLLMLSGDKLLAAQNFEYVPHYGGSKRWGYVDQDGSVVIEPQYYKALPFTQGAGLVLASTDDYNRWRFIDDFGRFISDEYGYAEPLSGGLGLVRETRKYYPSGSQVHRELGPPKHGYIGVDGEITIPLQFLSASSFVEGRALVNLDGQWGFISGNGRMQSLLPTGYEEVMSFSEGLAAVKNGPMWGFIDKFGKQAIPPRFTRVQSFSDGLAAVQTSEGWGYIDTHGTYVLEPQYEEAFPFHDGLAPIKLGNRWNFMDKSGEILTTTPRTFASVSKFSEGIAWVQPTPEDWNWIAINPSGRVVFEAELRPGVRHKARPSDFSSGMAIVWLSGTWRTRVLLSKSGDLVFDETPLGLRNRSNFYEGRASVSYYRTGSSTEMRFIDTTGHFAFEGTYDWTCRFSGGRAFVMKKDHWREGGTPRYFYIDSNGKRLTYFYDFMRVFFGPRITCPHGSDLVPIVFGGKTGYYNRDGMFRIAVQFENGLEFSEGLAAVKAGAWYFINTSGRLLSADTNTELHFLGAMPNIRWGEGVK